MAILRFESPGLLPVDRPTETPDTLTVDALVFYDGEHVDSAGKKRTYSAADIESIVEASNKRLKGGRRVKIFADHNYKQGNVIGHASQEFSAAEITADRLPLEGMTDLVGKQGIFAKVQLAGKENVQRYLDGRIKELSVGIDPRGNFAGVRNAIYEISAVGFPALAGAALFEQLEEEIESSTEQYALTLKEQLQQQMSWQLNDRLSMVFSAFLETLQGIQRATPEELGDRSPDQLKRQAVEDLAAQIKSRIDVADPTPLTTIPLFQAEEPMSEKEKEVSETPQTFDASKLEGELSTYKAELDKAKNELAQFKRLSQTTVQYGKLKNRAIELNRGGKMTMAQINDLFGADEEGQIVKFSATDSTDLEKIEFLIEQYEKYGQPIVQFGLESGNEPIEQDEDEAEKARKLVSSLRLSRPY